MNEQLEDHSQDDQLKAFLFPLCQCHFVTFPLDLLNVMLFYCLTLQSLLG